MKITKLKIFSFSNTFNFSLGQLFSETTFINTKQDIYHHSLSDVQFPVRGFEKSEHMKANLEKND